MKYLFLDCFAFLSPCMLASALCDMTKNKDVLKKLCSPFSNIVIYDSEEKRCGMEAGFLRLDYNVEKEEITKGELKLICEKLMVCEKTKDRLIKYIDIAAEAKSMDPERAVFDAKTATDALIFMAYIFETIFSLEAEKVYVSKVLIPSPEFCARAFTEKFSNAMYILKKNNICHTLTPIDTPSFAEEWAAMCAVLNASQKDTNTGSIIKIGYGAGEDDIEGVPNILRVVYGEEDEGDTLFETDFSLSINYEFA